MSRYAFNSASSSVDRQLPSSLSVQDNMLAVIYAFTSMLARDLCFSFSIVLQVGNSPDKIKYSALLLLLQHPAVCRFRLRSYSPTHSSLAVPMYLARYVYLRMSVAVTVICTCTHRDYRGIH